CLIPSLKTNRSSDTSFVPSLAHHPQLHSFPTRRSSDLLVRHTPTSRIITGKTGTAGKMKAKKQLPEQNNTKYSKRIATICKFARSEEHTSELQSRENLVCRLLLEKKKIEWKNKSLYCRY